jgi:isocitrate/isopropylmalate dehydrogenase
MFEQKLAARRLRLVRLQPANEEHRVKANGFANRDPTASSIRMMLKRLSGPSCSLYARDFETALRAGKVHAHDLGGTSSTQELTKAVC